MIAIQVGLFILIVCAYLAVFLSVEVLIGIVYGIAVSAARKLTGSELASLEMGPLANVCLAFAVAVSALFCYFRFDLQRVSLIRVWEGPGLLAIILLASAFTSFAGMPQTYNPILRSIGQGLAFFCIPAAVLAVVGATAPQLVHAGTFHWAFITTCAIRIVAPILFYSSIARKMRSFSDLDSRHDRLGAAIDGFNAIALSAGDADQWQRVWDFLAGARKAYDQALRLLRAGDLADADTQLIRGESEVQQMESLFNTVLRESFIAQLGARLEKEREIIVGLKLQLNKEQMSVAHLDEISSRLTKLQANEIALETISYTELASKVQPVTDLFSEIDDLQAAFRFQQNAGSAIEKIRRELEEKRVTIRIAESLELHTEKSEADGKEVNEGLKKFQAASFSSPEEVVRNYQHLQSSLSDLSQEIGSLLDQIATRWEVQRVYDSRIDIYVPRRCSTKEPVVGLILVRDWGGLNSISVSLVGTRLELQNETKFELTPSGQAITTETFSFYGKSGGKGALKLSISGISEPLHSNIVIESSMFDTIRDLAGVTVPVSAVVALLLWKVGLGLDESVAICTAVAGASALLPILFHAFRARIPATGFGRSV